MPRKLSKHVSQQLLAPRSSAATMGDGARVVKGSDSPKGKRLRDVSSASITLGQDSGGKALTWKLPVFARIRPPRANVEISTVVKDSHDGNRKALELVIPQGSDHVLHRHFERFRFDCFSNVFDAGTSNSEIYREAVSDVVSGVLKGFNGTIFAYGQTGSGKTYTITGGDSFAERGVVPWVISDVFKAFKVLQSKGNECKCHVSFLEIYNENMYDLLDSKHRNKPIEQWEKLQLLDDKRGALQVRGLRLYSCTSDKEALNMLFLGNINRMTSETPMNLASSRSHCIFTISIEIMSPDNEVQRSKLHLVDLAGSERVYRVAKDEQTAREGRQINLSLHYLENVIIALQDQIAAESAGSKQYVHVPYRNSMLTSVLRDSLGGNCRTVFIATLNPEGEFVGESLSTCRFAQRCSTLKQVVAVNKETDLKRVVRKLETEQLRLIERLKLAQERAKVSVISETETNNIKAVIDGFINATTGSRSNVPISNMAQASEAIRYMKWQIVKLREMTATRNSRITALEDEVRSTKAKLDEEVRIREAMESREREHRQHHPHEVVAKTRESTEGSYAVSTPRSDASSARSEEIADLRSMVDELRSELVATKRDADDRVALASVSGAELETELRKAIEDSHKKLEDTISERVEEEMQRAAMVPVPENPVGVPLPESESQESGWKSMLKRGGVFLKHGRYGNPHPRFVWISHDLTQVMWRKVGDHHSSATNAVMADTIIAVRMGRSTPQFRRDTAGPKLRPHCVAASFSVVFSSRTLDLEVDSHGLQDDESIRSRRNGWVDAFELLRLLQVEGARKHVRSQTSAV